MDIVEHGTFFFLEAAGSNNLPLCLDLVTKLSEVKMDLSPKTFLTPKIMCHEFALCNPRALKNVHHCHKESPLVVKSHLQRFLQKDQVH